MAAPGVRADAGDFAGGGEVFLREGLLAGTTGLGRPGRGLCKGGHAGRMSPPALPRRFERGRFF